MSIEGITQPIRTNSMEEHIEILKDRFVDIQLEYVDRLFSKKILPINDRQDVSSIEKIMLDSSPSICHDIKKSYKVRIGDKFNDENYKLFQQKILEDISVLYHTNHKNWISETKQLIKKELEKIGEIPKKESDKEVVDEKKERKAGLLNFEIVNKYFFNDKEDEGNEDEDSEEDKYDKENKEKVALLSKELGELSIDESDIFVAIHLEGIFFQKDENIKNIFSSNSLQKLAVEIVDNYPEAKAILAKSWLMDTPLAKRIGFTILGKPSKRIFWGQFLNSEGQIDEARISQFLETGKPPYAEVDAFFKTEDFLKKYLPKERLEEVNSLKKVKVGFEKQFQDENHAFQEFLNTFNQATEEDINKFFSSHEIFYGFSKTEEGKGFIELMKDLREQEKDMKNVKNLELLKPYKEPFMNYLKKIKFIRD